MTAKSYVGLFLILFSLHNVRAQEKSTYDYGSEFIWAVQGASNSGLISGAVFRYGWKMDDQQLQNVSFEAVYIKHPQELRKSNPFTGKSYIWGKSNYLINTRMLYGREAILFRKAPQQGVQINAMAAGGLTLGWLIPYYYELSGEIQRIYSINDQSAVTGSSGILQGLPSTRIKPGLSLKASIMFEYGTFKSNLTGFELGLVTDFYFSEVEIVAYGNNRAIYPALFINIIFGSRF